METKPPASILFRPRIFLAFLLFSAGVCLATFSFNTEGDATRSAALPEPERYMPVPGGESDDLDRMEQDWNNRLTYPTGVFNPEWVRLAAVADAAMARSVPFGERATLRLGTNSATALDPTNFTSLGPKPLRMTGCSGCYDYGTTEGRVNDIVVDPTTTTNGSIVAYAATVGGGVWKTTNCCGASTTWTVKTDDPLLATISIDTLTIDPNNHNTIYAGTGDLNYGSFSMGSQGILKSTDAGASCLARTSLVRRFRNPLDNSRNTTPSEKCGSIRGTVTTSSPEPKRVCIFRMTVARIGRVPAQRTLSRRSGRTLPASR
jgi:hypothetical protein